MPSPELLFMYLRALADFHSRIHKYVRAAWCTLWRGLSYTSASGDTGCAYLEGWQAWRMSANAGQGATRLLRTTNDGTRRDATCPRQDEFSVRSPVRGEGGKGDFTFTDLHESNYGVLLLLGERNTRGGYSAASHAAKPPSVLTTDTGGERRRY